MPHAASEPRPLAAWMGVLVYVAVALAWSWPLVLSPASATVSLHFDQLPAAWLVHAAPSFRDGVSELSAWPDGEPLVRLDSFLFLALSMALQGLLPGLFVTNLFVLFGPVASAWAAERFAREALGVGRVAGLVAGLCFGFAPLATVAALEGHCYYLLDPWMPLCALATWQGRWRAATVHFALALLTTAYLGVDTLLVVGTILLYQRRLDRRILGGIGVMSLLYAALFVAGTLSTGRTAGGEAFEALLRVGSASLATLVAWTPWMDTNRHSLAPVIGLLPLCFALLAPFRLASRPWLPLGLLAGLGALGPVIEAGVAREGGVPSPLWPLLQLGVFAVYRFPVRLAWISALVLGGLAARLVDQMSAKARIGAVILAIVDVLFVSGAWERLRVHPMPTPTLYGLLPEAPVLELYPRLGGLQEDLAFYNQNLSCYYQIFHGRPILDRCLNTDIRTSPRLEASDRVTALALGGEDVVPELFRLRVGSVVMHADLYQPGERSELRAALTRALGDPLEGRDGGEWLYGWPMEER